MTLRLFPIHTFILQVFIIVKTWRFLHTENVFTEILDSPGPMDWTKNNEVTGNQGEKWEIRRVGET